MKFELVLEIFYVSFAGMAVFSLMLNFLLKIKKKEIQMRRPKMRDFVKFLIILLLYHTYFIYICLILPYSIWLNFSNLTKLVIWFFFRKKMTINKPCYLKYNVFSLKSSLALIFIYFPRTWSFILMYILCYPGLKKNFSFKKLIENIGIAFLTARPIWFWNLTYEISTEIEKLLFLKMWKRKKVWVMPLILFGKLENIYYGFLFKKLLFYGEATKNLKLDLDDLKINGLDQFLANIKCSKNLLVLDKFSLLEVRYKPHLVLSDGEHPYGQIMTKSKGVYIDGQRLPTNHLQNTQNTIFSLYNKNQLLEDEDMRLEQARKVMESLAVKNMEQFMGFLCKTNMFYLTEISDKIIWQNSNDKMSMVLDKSTLPLTDLDFDPQTGSAVAYMRYKFTPDVMSSENFFENLRGINEVKKELSELDIEDVYARVQVRNFDDIEVIEEAMTKLYLSLKDKNI